MKSKFEIGEKVVVIRNYEHPLIIGKMGYIKEIFPSSNIYKVSIGINTYTLYANEIAKLMQ